MVRKRKVEEGEEEKENIDGNGNMGWDQLMNIEAAALVGGARRARKRYVGVQQRPSGRWVAEIKDTIQKIWVPGGNKCTGIDHYQQASVDDCEMGGEDIDVGIVNFHFVDDVISSCFYYSPFEITEELVEKQESYGGEKEEPYVLTKAMKRIKYEHKFSASLYAFNGISKCLKLELGSETGERGEVVQTWT
ncbi:hypothetical protein HYC85_006113 [Camellia sinensis]|uniref:AP2/ERF domain-containing protein n=1 Tax=Camellia sinensis TaxID=4442 RepID=A0A7J7I442_CAMSI|nr:hypothetical protein HYC85_006113 [Camellia sinensis]